MKSSCLSGAVICISTFFAPCALGGESTILFSVIPAPAGYQGFRASAISKNGDVVIGRLNRIGGGFSPGRWSALEGFTALPIPAGIVSAEPNGVSFDGSVITASGLGSQFQQSFRWTLGGGSQPLGVPPGHMQFVTTGVSDNGQRLVGNGDLSLGSRAYRRQVGSPFFDLGTISDDPRTEVFAISGDGLTSVGRYTAGGFPSAHVCLWTDQTGLVPLPSLPWATTGIAYAVSEHGEAVAGRMLGGLYGSEGRAFYWTSELGTIDIAPGIATAVSADGRVVAGNRISTTSEAWIWTLATGRISIRSILTSNGINLTGWNLYAVDGISADGLTVLGRGGLNGVEQNWVAQIPSAASGTSALIGIALISSRRRRAR